MNILDQNVALMDLRVLQNVGIGVAVTMERDEVVGKKRADSMMWTWKVKENQCVSEVYPLWSQFPSGDEQEQRSLTVLLVQKKLQQLWQRLWLCLPQHSIDQANPKTTSLLLEKYTR